MTCEMTNAAYWATWTCLFVSFCILAVNLISRRNHREITRQARHALATAESIRQDADFLQRKWTEMTKLASEHEAHMARLARAAAAAAAGGSPRVQ